MGAKGTMAVTAADRTEEEGERNAQAQVAGAEGRCREAAGPAKTRLLRAVSCTLFGFRLRASRAVAGDRILNYSFQSNIERCDIMKGKVKMFNAARGFGFITGDDGKDVYVHTSAIVGGAALEVGDVVEYEVEEGERGPRAKNVKKA